MKKTNPTPTADQPRIEMIRLALIDDHPALKYLPTLESAAAMIMTDEENDGDGPSGDWNRLVASIEAVGLIEPLKAMAAPEGRWWCADGRSRLAALRKIHGHEGDVPVIVVTEIDAETIARETLSRRQAPPYVAAYFMCRQNEEAMCAAKRGGDRSKFPKGNLITQELVSLTCGCRLETVNACVAALRHFREHPADRERDEPKILAGLMHPSRFIHAAAGREATGGKERRPTSFVSWAPKWKSMVSNLRGWDEWAEADRDNAKALLTKEAAEWPEGFRAVITEILNPQ